MQKTFNSGYLFAALIVAIWSGFIIITRLGGTSALTSFDITALRFGVAALVLLPLWYIRRASVQLFTARILGLTLTGGLGYALLAYSGFKFAPAAHAAVLLPGILPFEVAIIAWLVAGEVPNRSRWVALMFIAGGVLCLAADAFHGEVMTWPGDLMFVAASTSWALYTVLARRWAVNPWDTTISVTTLAALLYLPVYFLFLPKQLAAASWLSIGTQAIYQGVFVAVVAMIIYMKALEKIGATRLGTFMAVVPAIAGTIAPPLLGEVLSVWIIAGLALVSVGAWIGSRYGTAT